MISPEEGIIENIVYFKEDYMIKNLFLREDNKFVKKFGIQKVKSAIQEIQKLDMIINKYTKSHSIFLNGS
ncbi:hypothetical protein [Clostridium thermobutyricum]|uniref:hypothetical protein n=1 Tax=Clostridium thermobutyricum TaxID=29372 RepID=UPI0018AADCC1|nr:hypothetical protein [Clostridium thermobutyricum]